MKKLFALITGFTLLISCSTDDETNFLIGEEYVYNAPDCEPSELFNACFSFIRFINSKEADYLPGGDIIYSVDYIAVDNVVRLKMSEYFGEGSDVRLRIESEDSLIEIENEFSYVRQ